MYQTTVKQKALQSLQKLGSLIANFDIHVHDCMLDLFVVFVDRYINIQDSFSIAFCL